MSDLSQFKSEKNDLVKFDEENKTHNLVNKVIKVPESNRCSTSDKGGQQVKFIEYDCSITAAPLEVSKSYPVGKYEAVCIGIDNLKKTIVEIFGPDTRMFDYMAYILMAAGLKYVHHQNKETNKETKEHVNQNNQATKEAIKDHVNNNNQALKEYVYQNNQAQNDKLKDNLKQIEKYVDKSIANLRDDIKEKLRHGDLISTLQSQQDNKSDVLLLGLEKLFDRKVPQILSNFATCQAQENDSKWLNLQDELLTEANSVLKEEQKKVSLKSDKAYHDEQELALREAMRRYTESFGNKYVTIPYDKVQNAIQKYKSNLSTETLKLKDLSKSPDEVERIASNLDVEANKFSKEFVDIMKPTMRFMRPLMRRIKP